MIDIESVKKEYDELLQQLTSPELLSDWPVFEELSQKKKWLEKIIEKYQEIEELEKQIQENKAIISSGEDADLTSLAEKELGDLIEKEKLLKEDLAASEKTSITPPTPSGRENPNEIIMEIRAGAGGDEAGMFVADLYRMYSRYAENKNWQLKTLDSNSTGIGGFKEIIFALKGGDVFSRMRHEAGVHRVQRIPVTEKSGRIHTSTASVAVLPKPKKTEIKISPADLKTDVYKSSGPGGQYVNKRETAVRITHLPTGLVVTSQTERNLLQNKENALAILEARLLASKEEKERSKLGKERKTQIGGAKRAEKIRTYNFPQDRVTDHRIKKSWHDIERIMDGALDQLTEDLQSL